MAEEQVRDDRGRFSSGGGGGVERDLAHHAERVRARVQRARDTVPQEAEVLHRFHGVAALHRAYGEHVSAPEHAVHSEVAKVEAHGRAERAAIAAGHLAPPPAEKLGAHHAAVRGLAQVAVEAHRDIGEHAERAAAALRAIGRSGHVAALEDGAAVAREGLHGLVSAAHAVHGGSRAQAEPRALPPVQATRAGAVEELTKLHDAHVAAVAAIRQGGAAAAQAHRASVAEGRRAEVLVAKGEPGRREAVAAAKMLREAEEDHRRDHDDLASPAEDARLQLGEGAREARSALRALGVRIDHRGHPR